MKIKSIAKIILIALLSISASILVLFVCFGGYSIPNKSNIIGFPNDKVYFNMSPSNLKSLLGETDKITIDTLTPFNFYDYKQTIFGIESENSYAFYRSPFGKQLTKTITSIPVSNEEQGKEIVNKVFSQLSNVYSGKTDYFNEGITNTNYYGLTEITANLGIKHSATGINIFISYDSSSNVVWVDIEDQS